MFLKEKKANQQQYLGKLHECKGQAYQKRAFLNLPEVSQVPSSSGLPYIAPSPDWEDSRLNPELHGIEIPTIRLLNLAMTIPFFYSGVPVLAHSASCGNSQLQGTCYMPGNERDWV